MSSPGLIYLVTGANRGIGRGILQTLVARPNTTVIAAVRDPAAASSSGLREVPVGVKSKLIVVKLDASIESDAASAAKDLEAQYGISHIDVLLSNAGILETAFIVPALETPVAGVRKHIEINALAPLALIQAFVPLLEKSSAAKFLVISSCLGSLASMEQYPVPFFTYGISKAAANFLVRKMAMENPKLVSIAYSPGWVQTDMGNSAAGSMGMESAPVSLEESVSALIKLFDEASLEKSGSFFAHTGDIILW